MLRSAPDVVVDLALESRYSATVGRSGGRAGSAELRIAPEESARVPGCLGLAGEGEAAPDGAEPPADLAAATPDAQPMATLERRRALGSLA